jgi:acyl carrier protein
VFCYRRDRDVRASVAVLSGVQLLADDEQVPSKIMAVIRSLDGITPDMVSKITPRTNIVRDLNLDSIAVMDFIMELELAFDTVIPLETVAGIETLADIARVLDPQTALVAS